MFLTIKTVLTFKLRAYGKLKPYLYLNCVPTLN